METVKQYLKDFKLDDSQNGITQCETPSVENRTASVGGLNTAFEDSKMAGGLAPSRAANDDTAEPNEVVPETEKPPQGVSILNGT